MRKNNCIEESGERYISKKDLAKYTATYLKNKSLKNRNALLTAIVPYAAYIARRLSKTWDKLPYTYDDFFSVAMMGATTNIHKWDPKKGASLATYLFNAMMFSCRRLTQKHLRSNKPWLCLSNVGNDNAMVRSVDTIKEALDKGMVDELNKAVRSFYKLPDKLRIILIGRLIEKKTLSEVAEELSENGMRKMTKERVRQLQNAAMIRLRELYGIQEDQDEYSETTRPLHLHGWRQGDVSEQNSKNTQTR